MLKLPYTARASSAYRSVNNPSPPLALVTTLRIRSEAVPGRLPAWDHSEELLLTTQP
jgi:hypothetical protein